MAFFTQLLLLGLSIFLMIVILLQRGRGGGLAGAFGGLGGQSAFGTKAGDVFTKITVVVAVCWVIVAGGSGYFLRAGAESRSQELGDPNAAISTDESGDEDDFNPLDEFTPDDGAGESGEDTLTPDPDALTPEDGTPDAAADPTPPADEASSGDDGNADVGETVPEPEVESTDTTDDSSQ